MTDWETLNIYADEDEMDHIDHCAEYGELNDYQKDKLQGIEETKEPGWYNPLNLVLEVL